ncbi:MAG: hypothetical protein JWQ11_3746 [Rhizobacter sp.]|nr:hypothetical protein [Rhizobacter sp.]
MALHFDLIAAGVLAPGIGSIGQLIERAATSQRLDSPIDGTASHGASGRGDRFIGTMPGRTGAQASEAFLAPSSTALPANERRRASAVVRLALACAEQALAFRPDLAACVRLVFASDEGVGDVSHQMLDALANDRPLSPLVFANSVHNAPSGYFSIAHHNRRPSISLSSGAQSFAGGLLCAAAEAEATGEPVLFVSYDSPLPMPLRSLLSISQPSASAWLIVAPDSMPPDPVMASFGVELIDLDVRDGGARIDVTPLQRPIDHRPHWLPATWTSNSSALGIAALGLLAEASGTRDFSLGRQAVRLSRLQNAS